MEERSFWKINVRWEEKKKVFKVQVVEIKSATMMKNVFSDKLTFKKMLLRGGEVVENSYRSSTISPQISSFLSFYKNLTNETTKKWEETSKSFEYRPLSTVQKSTIFHKFYF